MIEPTSEPARAEQDGTGPLVAESLLRSAILSLQKGDYEGAERSLRQGLAHAPDHAGCLASLAICLATGQRRYVTAERLARRAVRVAPQDACGYYALGRIHLLGAHKQMAHQFLNRAARLAPQDPHVQLELQAMGRRRPPVIRHLPRGHPLNVTLGRLRAFLADGRRLALVATLILVTLVSLVSAARSETSLEKENHAIAGGLARIDSLLSAGDNGGAAQAAQDLLARHPGRGDLTWQAQERLGLALFRLGRGAEAVRHFEAAIRAAPESPSAHHNLATTLMALGQRGRGFAEYQEAVALAPEDWRTRLDYGQALLSYRQDEAAGRQLREADRICGGCPEVARAMAAWHLTRDDQAAALPLLEKAYAAQPARDLRRALALARLRTGSPAGARALLLPEWPQGLTAEELRLVLEADRALGDPERASALPDLPEPPPGAADPLVWGLAGQICLESSRDGAALRALDRAIALDPNEAGFRHNRALALLRLGRETEAAAELARARALDPRLGADPQ